MASHIPGNSEPTLNLPTRGRPQLSCTPCKRRKLKCDRARPCDNCTKRREPESCVYPLTSAVRDQSRASKQTKKRLDRLESLVMGLISEGLLRKDSLRDGPAFQEEVEQPQTISPNENGRNLDDNDPLDLQSALDKPSIPTPSSSPALWESILRDIGEIRTYFEEHELDFREHEMRVESSRSPLAGTNILHSSHGECDVDTLLSSLPARPTVDLLIANYFGERAQIRPLIHPKKFLREYKKFWEDPSAVSKVWLGLLFAIMRQAVRVSTASGIDLTHSIGDVAEAISVFRTRVIQCLASSDYSKPTMEQLETLSVHLESEFFSSPDSKIDVWIQVGSLVRLAMRNGLHREPSLFPEFSPFQCEMRRRMWLAIVTIDTLMSFQVGLPAMIPRGQHDTMLPRNLREDDFDEDSTALPLSRPMNEVTKMTAFIVKARLLEAFGKIASHNLDIHPDEAAVATLESELYAARDALPPYYKVRPLEECSLDPPYVVMGRMILDQTVHTGLCILHRRRLSLARSNPQLGYSRKVCVDAALTLLSYQAIHHREAREGGRLEGYEWMATSVAKNDYLLAAMIICLDLRLSMSGATYHASTDLSLWGRNRREEMMQALETSYRVWRDSKDTSIEAFRASEAVSVMLRKVRREEGQTDAAAQQPSLPPRNQDQDVIVPSALSTEEPDPYNLNLPLSEMVSSPNDIDWMEFDRVLRGSNNSEATS